ncbi:MAG: CARDB domain-containing protein [Planctomycetia bacterium]
MSDRPSRQDLVVSPKRSNLVLMLGAIVSAGAGFAAVWALSLGQSSVAPADGTLTLPVTTVADPAGGAAEATEPGRFAPAAESIPATAAPGGDTAPRDRYGIQPTSLDAPAGVVRATGEAKPMSRFSLADDGAAQPLAATEPTDLLPPPGIEQPETIPADDATTPPSSEPERSPRTTTPDLDPEPAAPVAAAPAPEVESEPDADSQPDAVVSPRAATPPDDAGNPAGAPFPKAAPPAAFPKPNPYPSPAAAAPIPQPGDMAAAGSNPLRAPATTVTAAVPFASAPPLGPPPASDLQPPAAAPRSADAGISSGQGRPGPAQLEGVQAPQLTVEKRGPREVQVGKAARYEILVRNVGSATAHDVMLHDSVPYGTALVTTTPPASPVNPATAGPAGDLAWMLGSLPPGGQARVAMEVMPKLEGDIGSVASVTFRADASVRSRATKPDLRLDVTDPKPVLIGRDVKFPITITNPGTGVATGVVLEGLLPDQLTHRAGKELEFDVGQLQPGGSRTVDFSLGSTGPGVHTIRLVARADGQIEVERIIKVEITAPTLELEAEMPARRYLQRPAACTISMANTGTAPAKAVELAAQLPPGVKFVRANNAGYYDERTHRVLWNLEELPAAERGSVEFVVMPVDLGPQKIVAAARSADGLSDQVAHTIEVEGLAAVTFEVTDSEDPIEVAGLTEYVIRVGNQGTKAASGVRVAATILGEMEPVEAKGPSAHRIDNLTVTFEPLARLAPTEEAIYRVRVRGHRAGDQRMQVQLTSDDHPSPITKEEITRVYADR